MARAHIAFACHRLFAQRFGVERGNGLLRCVVKRGGRIFCYAKIGWRFLFGQSLPIGAVVLFRFRGDGLCVLGDLLRLLLNLLAEILQFLF